MKNIFSKLSLGLALTLWMSACSDRLNLTPTNDVTSESVFKSVGGYKQALAKVYASFATTGNAGPAGAGDVQGIDEGTSDFLRLWWKAQELSTDEAVVAWGDAGIQDFHNMNWSSDNPMLTGLYYRSLYQITLCNEFIRQSTDDKLSSRGISGADANQIKGFAEEARFLRAFQYWVLMDLFGNPPFATENTEIGGAPPSQTSRAALFSYIESELLRLENSLPAPRANEYGRADKAAAWALLSRLYLNANVYTGSNKYNQAATYAKKVIDAGYTLESDYTKLMRADNNKNAKEFIFTINYDGTRTQNYGGTNFITHGAIGGSMVAADFGVNGGWAGLRTTKALVNQFPSQTGSPDARSQFHGAGQNLEITELTKFGDGFGVTKFKNLTATGAAGSSLEFVDIDFPLFRAGEAYLNYAEAVVRGATTGDRSTALSYINGLRTRAYGNTNGNIGEGDMTLDFMLAERSRELYWEGLRRTDLIRFDKFVEESYLWPWKGGVKDGKSVSSHLKLYPLPSADLIANRNLNQNAGYN